MKKLLIVLGLIFMLAGNVQAGVFDGIFGSSSGSGDILADGSVPMTGVLTTVGVEVKNGATSSGFVDFYEDSDNGTSYHRLYGPSALAGNIFTILPATAGATGGQLYFASANTLGIVAVGTAYQVWHMNSGATAPEWTSTLGATGTRLTKGWFTNLEITNAPTINGAAWTTILQPVDATLTALAGATLADVSIIEGTGADAVAVVTSGGANRLLGSNSDNTALEFKDTINAQFSDDAAQFKSATASKGTMKVLLTGSTADKLLTVAYNHTDNKTINVPDPTTGDSVALGSAAIRFNTGGATARVKTLSDSATTLADVDGALGTPSFTALNMPSSNADPATTAGNTKHDSTDTGSNSGGTAKWYDGAQVRSFVDTGTNYTIITKTEYIPIGYAEDGAAAPAVATVWADTRKAKIRVFAADADDDVEIHWMVPNDYVGGVKFRAIGFVDNATAPANTETVILNLAGCSVGDSDDGGCTLGTGVDSTFTADATYAQHDRWSSAWSNEITVTNIAASESVMLKLFRDVDDTYAQGIGVAGIEIKYKAKIIGFGGY